MDTKERMKYYKQIAEDVNYEPLNDDDVAQTADFAKIYKLGLSDVVHNRDRRTREDFASYSEFKVYAYAVYETAVLVENELPVGYFEEDDQDEIEN